jgi:hypothetical protein
LRFSFTKTGAHLAQLVLLTCLGLVYDGLHG